MGYKYRDNSKSRAMDLFYAVVGLLFVAIALVILGIMVSSMIGVFSHCISCSGGFSLHMLFIWTLLFVSALFFVGLAGSYYVTKESKYYTKKFDKWYLRYEMEQALLGLHVGWHSAKDRLKGKR